MNKYYKLILIFLLLGNIVKAQIDDDNINSIETIIENIASDLDEDIDYTTLYDNLMNLYNNPIDINNCTAEDLEKLYFINMFQVKMILNYREKYGIIYSKYELQLIEGFDNDIITKLIPFITINSKKKQRPFSLKNTFKYGGHQIFLRTQSVLEEQQGYNMPDSLKTDGNNYLGSSPRIYAKYKFKYSSKILFGITAEKDPGEEFFKGTQAKGFDFYSAHLQINNIGIVKKIVLGDYIAQFGQGLTLYRGMSFGKSPNVLNIMKSSRGIKRYSSSNEIDFFRGAAVTLGENAWGFSTFYSNRMLDGSIQTDTLESEDEYINAITTTSNHSTLSGIAKRNKINEHAFGGNLSYTFSKLKLGLTGVYSKYNTQFVPSNKFDKLYALLGDNNYNIGVDYQLSLSKFYFFGELSTDKNFNTAFISGVNVKIAEQLYWSTLYRNYSKKYVGLYANGFTESSSTNNEVGIYSGIVYNPVKAVKISAYWDSYKFNWMNYRVASPSNGYDYFIQADYTPLRDFVFSTYLRREVKSQNVSGQEQGVKNITDIDKIRYRFHIAYSVNENITLKNRFEHVIYNNGINNVSNGYLVYQDIAYNPKVISTVFHARLSVFDTYDYNSRIYAYENDVLYAFSVPAYYGKGMRYYFVVKQHIYKGLDVWFRFSQTIFTDRKVVGSGVTEIDGNKKTEIKVQMRYSF